MTDSDTVMNMNLLTCALAVNLSTSQKHMSKMKLTCKFNHVSENLSYNLTDLMIHGYFDKGNTSIGHM